MFVRGGNGHIYYMYKNVSNGVFQNWSNWVDMGSGFNSDPSAVSWAWGRTDLVARKNDGLIYIRSYTNGNWSEWSSLGAPAAGAASAPAITSWGKDRLDLFVRGGDNRLYWKVYSNGWSGWSQVGNGTFLGKPSAASWGPGRIDVAVHGMDHALWTISYTNGWNSFYSLGGQLHNEGQASSPAIASMGANRLDILTRGVDSRLWQKAWTGNSWTGFIQLGGILGSDPAAVGKANPQRIDIVAANHDYGALGLWWKYWPWPRPCYFNSGCGQCGCGDPGQPSCIGE